ncbi:glutaredoxin [Helicocarpus griseus UAMH5409]|uniref:Glutaredoxin n=1 Tax=Helicocarpus griseus UAMH5409 TaxID=1447875 RepID=A0A2B7WFV6_9EURO|nr:glutaredoxin [Helicocarpus griseus UAMH5409]
MKATSPAFPTRHASFPVSGGRRLMQPNRRGGVRLLLLAVLAIVFFICYLSAGARHVRNEKYYQRTVEAMDAKAARAHSEMDDDGLFLKLRTTNLAPEDKQAVAVERQKYESPLKMTPGEGGEGGEEKSIAGRKKMPASNDKPPAPEDKEDPEVVAELNAILKRSPIIIFSKSYCPYSHKAKNILLNRYTIVPAPFVVELDIHPLGPKLQEVLAGNTGRGTVPNVLVNGKSIGGGDDIQELHDERELAAKIKGLAGKRVMEITMKQEKAL